LQKHLIVFIVMAMDTQVSTAAHDWHSADIKAALEKRGLTLRQLALKHGYAHFQRVLSSPWWAVEQILAKELGQKPEVIWPSRYAQPRNRAQILTRMIRVTPAGRIHSKPRAAKAST
jgi:Ner family transcriptional regulator